MSDSSRSQQLQLPFSLESLQQRLASGITVFLPTSNFQQCSKKLSSIGDVSILISRMRYDIGGVNKLRHRV